MPAWESSSMTYYPDLSDYVYTLSGSRPGTRNVGWIDTEHEFNVGAVDQDVLSKIWAHTRISVIQTRGIHMCSFCSPETAVVERNSVDNFLLGSAEIRVLLPSGGVYSAPDLLFHYIREHSYRPPDQFLTDLAICVDPGSQEYIQQLNELKLEWNKKIPRTNEETIALLQPVRLI